MDTLPPPPDQLPHHVAFHARETGAAVMVRGHDTYPELPPGGRLWRYVYPDESTAYAATATSHGHELGGAPCPTRDEALRNLRALRRSAMFRGWAAREEL
jgi:hypothetical protein